MGEKPYACQHCDASYSDSSSLTKHVRTHTGEKPYACKHCDAAFSQSGTLAKHSIVHTPGHAQQKKLSEMHIENALKKAGYIKCGELGDAAPPPGHFYREKVLTFKGCVGMNTEQNWCKVDFVVCASSGALVFLEVDESQHFDRPTMCEVSRMTNAYESMLLGGTPLDACIWLRYNPHERIDAGLNEIVTTPSRPVREEWLVQFLNDARLLALRGIRVLYAYYDNVDLDELGMVPARALEFDYSEHLRALSFDAHLHAFDEPRPIDDATAEVAWGVVEEKVDARQKKARGRLTAMRGQRQKRKRHADA